MDIIKRIIDHTDDKTKINYENEVIINGDCISLKTKKIAGRKSTQRIIKEYHLDELKEEYQKICADKSAIENLLTKWGVIL